MKLLLVLLITFSAYSNIIKVYDTKNQVTISYEDFITVLPNNGYVVMGEFHNDIVIQGAQARIMGDKVVASGNVENFNFMWEFLDSTSQGDISELYSAYKAHRITAKDLISQTAGEQNLEYTPLLETTKYLSGHLVALNLPRSIKQQVVRDGLDSINPSLVPPNYQLGGEMYLERFNTAMGGHVPADMVMKYFVAQSLVDSVMSYFASENERAINFIVAGSFHTDFDDATTKNLKELTTSPVTSLKIFNSSDMTDEDIQVYLNGDERYGAYADYIVITK